MLEYDDKKPTANPNITTDKGKSLFFTKCTIPPRDGHHVIYGEWGRFEPTIERFHGCIDIAIGNAPTAVGPKPRPASKAPRLQGAAGKQADMLGRIRDRRSVPTPTQAVPR
jgi:predicted carbohydrate-binding protein with CBM5 and CBM33 domain